MGDAAASATTDAPEAAGMSLEDLQRALGSL